MPLDNGNFEFYELMKAQIITANEYLKSVGAPLMDVKEHQDSCDVCNEYGYVVAECSGLCVCSFCYDRPI